MARYRFVIFGAGAIGTYLGASLLGQGHQVVFLEREKDQESLSQGGIKMVIDGNKQYFPEPDIITDIGIINKRSFDLAILALKTYHLDQILPDLIHLRDKLPPFLCLQNGVSSEDILRQAIGAELVIPGTVTTAVDRIQKGDILVRKNRGMGIAGDHPLIDGLLLELRRAGLNPKHYLNADDMKWSKLILNLLGNASSAILNLPPARIFADPALFKMERNQILEAVSIMDSMDIGIVDLPGVPVRLLVTLLKHVPTFISRPLLGRLIGGGRGDKMPSFHIDLHSGKGLSEVDHLNGAVVKAGMELNQPTPVNSLLNDILSRLLDGSESLKKYDHKPQVLLSNLAAL
jgi:2-dehydropantoate 2-reductase